MGADDGRRAGCRWRRMEKRWLALLILPRGRPKKVPRTFKFFNFLQMRMLSNFVISITMVGALLAQPPSLDPGAFALLNESEKQAFVLSVVQHRDAQLQNFSYQMTHSDENHDPKTGKRHFWGEDTVGLKRLGLRLFLTVEALDSQGRPQSYKAAWDGQNAKSLLHSPHRNIEYGGVIQNEEDDNFTYRAFNHILGLRILDSPNLTLEQWFDEATTREDCSIDIDVVEDGGKSFLMFKVNHRYKYWQWFLDPQRDYMPVRAEVLYKYGDNYNSDSSLVQEAIQVDGLWVPKTVFRVTGTSASEEQTENTYQITAFARNMVSEEDFRIDFPPGTEVVDRIAGVAYKVLPNGGIELLPLADESGKILVRDNSTPVVADNSTAETIKSQYTPLTPQGPASAPVKTNKKWLSPGILTVMAGILLVYGGLRLISRNCRTTEDN